MTTPEVSQELHADVMVWNLADGFSDPRRAVPLQNEILRIQPDIAAFPEAAIEGEPLSTELIRGFRDAGYAVHETDYDDTDGRKDRHRLAVVIKEAIPHEAYVAELAGRCALLLELSDPQVDFLAFHHDDRREGTRQDQVIAAASLLGPDAVAALDANAMKRTDPRARLLRAAGPFARCLPAADPQRGVKQPKLERIGSLLQRSVDMADGGTMALWRQAGFVDTSHGYAATMTLGGRRVLQLDRILMRGEGMIAQPARVLPHQNLSDHCPVVA